MSDDPPVFVVDDDIHVLDTVRCLLQHAGYTVHCFGNAKDFLEQLQPEQTGCLVTDLGMPDMDGLELQQRLRSMNSLLTVIVVTGKADVSTAVRLMRNGAHALLEKPYPVDQLLEAIKDALALSVLRGEVHMQRSSARRLLGLLDSDERQVIALAAEGLPNKAIAKRLALSPRTVDRRRQSSFNKLGIASVAGYTRLLSQAGEGEHPSSSQL